MKKYYELYEIYKIPKDIQNIIDDYIKDLMITEKMNKSIKNIKNKVSPYYTSIILNNDYTISVGFRVENKILETWNYCQSLYKIDENEIHFIPQEYFYRW